MNDEFVASAAKCAPVAGGNMWLWLGKHDINWWVAVATLAYISASFVFAWRKDRRDQRARERESSRA
ncbi:MULTISPECIES: hypothetical protein [unclassified Caballeronia]|uniref:hypothetical protein n=1 Tax=unclassified Caballeronia TaxID=2646786 RepID=UPI002867389E|nr:MULTISPECIES: hypothetical protein [unclassified Caballeronia]MDR5771012.1 hypothetical protein [Caballeronia sp. LZ002]MDR5802486.1 hypothetical protein [Caballeronia sp. LZ001]MDR5846449.1 hypothetical protein [Caballeronia sp. LZ003]